MKNQIVPFSETASIAKALAASGFFPDAAKEAQAIVKVLAGQELGLGPFASMTGLHIIQGKPVLGANLLATLIKNDPRYNYRVTELSDDACEIVFYENNQECGRSRFTIQDARKAGTKNLDKFPKNMLFARAISNGAKWFTPGIFGGAPVYTPEDFNLPTNEDGEIIQGQIVDVEQAPAPAPEPTTDPILGMTYQDAAAVVNSKGEKYGDLESNTLANMANAISKKIGAGTYTPEEQNTAEMKLEAIQLILKHRNQK